MNIQIGDQLLGYPVVGVTDTSVLVRLPGNIDIGFDRQQFTEGYLNELRSAGLYVPATSAG